LSITDNIHCHMARRRWTDPGLTRRLDAQLRQIAWSYASRATSASSDPEDWDDGVGTDDSRRAGALDLLCVYAHLADALEGRIDRTVELALANGASFGDIGSARGTSRQAERQRYVRSRSRRRARAARLPYKPVSDPKDFPRSSPTSPAEAPVDRVSAEKPSFRVPAGDGEDDGEKAGAGPHAGQRAARTGARKARVRELAAEFGVTSAIVMQKMQEMGEFVRSDSSIVETPVARVLREYFGKQQEVRGLTGATRTSAGSQRTGAQLTPGL
jgi:hypothetical protein